MKYEFIGKNLTTTFHSFEQVEGNYEYFVEGLSIVNALINCCEKNQVREIFYNIIPADMDLLELDEDDAEMEWRYSPDLDLYFEIFIDSKRQKSTVWVYSTDCPMASVYEAKIRRAR